MADLAVDVQILDATTQALVLDFSEAAGYQVVSVGEGARSFRRETAESDWVPGRALLSAVLDAQTSTLVVRCVTTTQTAMRGLVANARTAMENYSYILQVSLGGVVEKWLCEAADSTLGDSSGLYDQFEMTAVRQTLFFTIPRSPILLA